MQQKETASNAGITRKRNLSIGGKDGKARQELTRAPATEARCKPHLMQDPTGGDAAARRAPEVIAGPRRQRRGQTDDRSTTELGLRPRLSQPERATYVAFYLHFRQPKFTNRSLIPQRKRIYYNMVTKSFTDLFA